MKNYKGSNQFKKQHRFGKWTTLASYLFFVWVLVTIALWAKMEASQRKLPGLILNYIPKVKAQEAGQSAILKPQTTDQEDTENEIHQVFGEYTDKALLLLKGDGTVGACHENGSLNPNAQNNNLDQNGNIDSTDYGIFQINNKWQKITNVNFLKDKHINIRIAWNIFERDGHSFKLWTCGRYYGI